MSINCTSCGHALATHQYLKSCKQFVCPNCFALHDIVNEKLIFSKNLTFKNVEYPLDIQLGDTFKHHSKSYTILNIAKKKGVAETWFEFGGINSEGKWLFYSIAEGINSKTYSLNEFDLDPSFDLKKSAAKGINKFGKHFVYSYQYSGISVYSVGLFQYNIEQKTIHYPFNCDLENDNSFLSIETVGDEVYGFYGAPIFKFDLYNKFDKNKSTLKEKKTAYYNTFFKLAAYIGIAFMFLFLLFNYRGLFTSNYTYFAANESSNFSATPHNQLKIPIDLSKGKFTQLNLEGSIHSSSHFDVSLKFVNLSTHKVELNQNINLKYNYLNNASAINALIRNVQPEKYVVIIEPLQTISTPSTLDIKADFRVTTGQIINVKPIIFSLIFLVILLFIMHGRLEKNFSPKKQFDIKTMLLIDGKIYFVSLCLILTFYIGYETYTNYFRAVSVERLEDANYVGHTHHYIHRTYSSHK